MRETYKEDLNTGEIVLWDTESTDRGEFNASEKRNAGEKEILVLGIKRLAIQIENRRRRPQGDTTQKLHIQGGRERERAKLAQETLTL